MKSITLYIQPGLLIVLLLSLCFSLQAQDKEGLQPSDPLYREIQQLDSSVFEALNKRDTTTFSTYFSKDLEFYHDKGGLTGYRHTMDFLQSLIIQNSDLKRTLVKESFEVFPIPGYGAMEIGEHRFTHTENGRLSTGVFKFLHVWKKENGHWEITRVISYGH